MTDNDMVKRLAWAGLLAGVGALASIITTRTRRRDLPPRVRGRSAGVTPDEHTDAERERSEARGAELRSELAATDARRAEEETAEAEKAVEKADQAQGEARAQGAEGCARRPSRPSASPSASARRPRPPSAAEREAAAARARPRASAAFAAAGIESGADRPEILIGAAFAGAFIFARVLKRLVD